MRRYCLTVLVLTCILITPIFAQNNPEKILYFDTDITIKKDASIDVTENISVNANHNKIIHGIVRKLPSSYVDSYQVAHHTAYHITKILLNNQPANYHTAYANGQYEIFIGDRNVNLAPGIYTFTIQYHVNNAVNFLQDADELYWNITGNNWDFPIAKADATIRLPAGANILKYFGYTGYQGENSSDYVAREETSNEISFSTNTQLQPRQGLTIAVAWPKGIVQKPTMLQQLTIQVGPATYLLPLILLIMILYYITVWHKYGHDLHKRTIIPLFTPPANISPAAARYISRMGFDSTAYTAAIVSMATKGFLTIENNNGIYTLIKKGNDTSHLSEEEKAMANALFAGSASITVTRVNYVTFNSALTALVTSLKSQFLNKLFVKNSGYLIPGILLTLLSYAVIIYFSADMTNTTFSLVWLSIWTVGVIALLTSCYRAIVQVLRYPSAGKTISAIFITIFSLPFVGAEIVGLIILEQSVPLLIMPCLLLTVILNFVFYYLLKAPTEAGKVVIDQIEGFKLFLGTTERYRLNEMNPPNQTPETFESFMPYAIALNVEYEWGQNFNSLLSTAGQQPQTYHPRWYTGNTAWAGTSAAAFTTALVTGLGPSLASVSVASSASGGHGSSGGGGGGGGGGGW